MLSIGESTSPRTPARNTAWARSCRPSRAATRLASSGATPTGERQSLIGKPGGLGLFFFHGARPHLDRGSGPYFYLAELENHLEARLWNDVFCWAQDQLGIPRGTIRATVLIETITAAFEM